MAREHHCPNCGGQPCNASTSKIHTCGVCAAIWEEDLSAPVAAPSPPRPAAAPAAPPTPAATAPKPAPPTAVPPRPAAPPATPAVAAPAPKPAAPAAVPAAAPPPTVPAPATPKPAPLAAPAAAAPPQKPGAPPVPGGGKTLSEALQGAKVTRCPACQSDGVAKPSDFATVQGRLVLIDSQTYRAHQWYADTGELLPALALQPPAAPAALAPAAAQPSPAS